MCNAFARNPLKPVEIATSEIRPQCIAGYPESTADGASLNSYWDQGAPFANMD